MADEVAVPLNVILAFGLGLALGILAMVFFGQPQQTQILGGVAGTPRLSIQRDELGRIVGIQEVR